MEPVGFREQSAGFPYFFWIRPTVFLNVFLDPKKKCFLYTLAGRVVGAAAHALTPPRPASSHLPTRHPPLPASPIVPLLASGGLGSQRAANHPADSMELPAIRCCTAQRSVCGRHANGPRVREVRRGRERCVWRGVVCGPGRPAQMPLVCGASGICAHTDREQITRSPLP